MPARNPRVNVVLERPVYERVAKLANRENVSLSTKVRDLVKDALELQEDLVLTAVAERRERTFTRQTALKHDQVWGNKRHR
jgi:hypothetical protein